MRVLVVEDDEVTRKWVVEGLCRAGHSAQQAEDGDEALRLAMQGGYDLVILDRMLPGLDGLSLLRELRRTGSDVAAIFLTAMGSVEDRVDGLQAGADDYLQKPFAFSELLARMEAIARRASAASESNRLSCAELSIDRLSRRVTWAGEEILLQPTEYRLLEFLLLHTAQVVTRSMLLEHVWGFHFEPQTNIVEVHISRLRAKLDRSGARRLIHTVRGAGYRLADEG